MVAELFQRSQGDDMMTASSLKEGLPFCIGSFLQQNIPPLLPLPKTSSAKAR